MQQIPEKIKSRLKKIPAKPGVYLFYSGNELVYVGKASSLKSRVRSYFSGTKTPRPVETLIETVEDIKYEVTESVIEAVILEANYISKLKPKLNVIGKDDKSWNYLIITKEKFPRLVSIRQHDYISLKSNATKKQTGKAKVVTRSDIKYVYGPYPGLNTKEALRLLHKLFNVSKCTPNSKRCFDRQLGRCLGVCEGEISQTEYKEKVIDPLKMFLNGNKKIVIKNLEKNMRSESDKQNYEEAGRLRNQIKALKRIHDVSILNKSFFEDSIPLSGVSRIEAYDISNLGDTGIVGSLVVFNMSGPVKSEYKKFKIKTVIGQSDIDSLAEVLQRRLKHKEWILPGIFLIDGGKGQVNMAKKVLETYKVKRPVIGIAKGAKRKKNEFIFDNTNLFLKEFIKKHEDLLINARDEAHRFAISYQRKLREIKKK